MEIPALEGRHKIKIKVLNPKKGYRVMIENLIVYGFEEAKNTWKTDD